MTLKKKHAQNWKLYCIIDRDLLGKKDPVKLAGFLFRNGVKAIQLRSKNFSSYEMTALARKIAKIAKSYDGILIINDRPDVMIASDADGIHLGAGDFSPTFIRKISDKRKMIGKTAHSIKEAKKVQKEKIDYIGAGPVFATPVKHKLKPKGINFIHQLAKISNVPIYAIGGINKDRASRLFKENIDGVCVTRAAKEAKEILKGSTA